MQSSPEGIKRTLVKAYGRLRAHSVMVVFVVSPFWLPFSSVMAWFLNGRQLKLAKAWVLRGHRVKDTGSIFVSISISNCCSWIDFVEPCHPPLWEMIPMNFSQHTGRRRHLFIGTKDGRTLFSFQAPNVMAYATLDEPGRSSVGNACGAGRFFY